MAWLQVCNLRAADPHRDAAALVPCVQGGLKLQQGVPEPQGLAVGVVFKFYGLWEAVAWWDVHDALLRRSCGIRP